MMPEADLPTTLEKRELLYGKGAPGDVLVRTGTAYLAAGRPDEAAHFFHKAGETGRLKKVLADAVREGDWFTARLAAELLGEALPAAEWRSLAEEARKRGLEVFARRADEEALTAR